VPFASLYKRQSHFDAHGWKFGATSEEEYERMADEFMSRSPNPDLYDCIRDVMTNDRIRLEGRTRFFGVAYHRLTIRSFYPKDANSIASDGGPAGFVARKCAEVRLRCLLVLYAITTRCPIQQLSTTFAHAAEPNLETMMRTRLILNYGRGGFRGVPDGFFVNHRLDGIHGLN
jgi:hypothetical protein